VKQKLILLKAVVETVAVKKVRTEEIAVAIVEEVKVLPEVVAIVEDEKTETVAGIEKIPVEEIDLMQQVINLGAESVPLEEVAQVVIPKEKKVEVAKVVEEDFNLYIN
jgi:hypothetical protein